MQIIGTATPAELMAMKGRGFSPQEAVEAIIAEAKRRNPKAETVIVQKRATDGGFDIIAL